MDENDLMLDDGDWSDLPEDLLFLITENLKSSFSLLEYIRFGAVCFEWRSFIQNFEEDHIKLPSNLPVLLIPSPLTDDEEEDDDEDEQLEQEQHLQQDYYKPKVLWKGQDQTRHKSTRSFYSLSDRKVNQHFQLPVPYYKNCRGSSYGWLITVDEKEQQQPDGTTYYTYPVRLLNPFRSANNNEIQLPPLTTIPDVYLGRASNDVPGDSYFLIKAILSVNPSSLSNPAEDLLVLGILGAFKLGYCRPGDSAWTLLLERKFRPIEDIICYKNRFLAIIQNGSVLELEFDHHLNKMSSVKFIARTPANTNNLVARKYLVESAGDLLQVHRHVRDRKEEEEMDMHYLTTGFQVFKLNEAAASDDDKWIEMHNLDGRMLFLGNSSSISLSATDYPGLIPNSVYFSDDNHEAYQFDPSAGPQDIGLFNFQDRSIVFEFGDQEIFDPHYAKDNVIMPPPIWIQPML